MEAKQRRMLKWLVSDEQKRRWEKNRRAERQLEAWLKRNEEVVPVPSKGSEVAELIGHVRKAGYKVVRAGSQKHYKIQDSKGKFVTDDNGPLIISTSPSDHRWREMHVQRMMRAGVLKADPYKATGKQTRGPQANGDGAADEDEKPKTAEELRKERERAEQDRYSRSRNASALEGTIRLRSRFEPTVPHLGGWAAGAGPRAHLSLTSLRVLTVPELAQIIHHWATTRDRIELPRDKITKLAASAREVEQAARGLKSGGTISERWQPLVAAFIDYLYEGGSDPKAAADRYRVLLREQRGIIPAPGQEPAPEEEEPLRLGPLYQAEVRLPTLAFEALYLMARGGDDRGRAIELATKIAELELQQQGKGGS